jgi:hypothetical protein
MAPVWHRPAIHRTAEVHAVLRCGRERHVRCNGE